jgi:hypothetical protein
MMNQRIAGKSEFTGRFWCNPFLFENWLQLHYFEFDCRDSILRFSASKLIFFGSVEELIFNILRQALINNLY